LNIIAAFYEGYFKLKSVETFEGTVATGFGTDEHGNVKIVKLQEAEEQERCRPLEISPRCRTRGL